MKNMKKIRLYLNEENKVKTIYYDDWNGKEYDVPDDFEENWDKGIPYCLENDKIVIDSVERKKQEIKKEIDEKRDFLSNSDGSVNEAQEYMILGNEVPPELLVCIEKRQKVRDEITELEMELENAN